MRLDRSAAAALLVLVAALALSFTPSDLARGSSAVVLLLAPGWGLSGWWGRSQRSAVELTFAVLATGLAADVLLACLLGLTPLQLTRSSVSVGLALLGAIALATSPRVPADRVERSPGGRGAAGWLLSARVFLVLAAVLTLAAVLRSADVSRTQSEQRLDATSLSVVAAGAVQSVVVVADRAGTYRLVVSRGGELLIDRTQELSPGQRLSLGVDTPQPVGASTALAASLYRDDGPTPLRTVRLDGSVP